MNSTLLPRELAYPGLEKFRIEGGLRINHPPHIGTYFFLCCCFTLASQIAKTTGIETEVHLQLLDNAPVEMMGNSILQGFRKPLYFGANNIDRGPLFLEHYGDLLTELQAKYSISCKTMFYSEFQALSPFRRLFLDSLSVQNELGWIISPFHSTLDIRSVIGLRFCCPNCGFSSFYGQETTLLNLSKQGARFTANCSQHGSSTFEITVTNATLIDLQKILRNIMKIAVMMEEKKTLPIIAKGVDWQIGYELVDQGLTVLGIKPPPKVFFPIIVTDSGLKLSKSGLHNFASDFSEVPDWVASPQIFLQKDQHAVEKLIRAAKEFLNGSEEIFLGRFFANLGG